MKSPDSERHSTSKNSSDPRERRVNERICVYLPLVLNGASDSDTSEEKALSRDMSSSGAYCYLKQMLKIGNLVDLQIAPRFLSTPRSLFPSLILAEVVRVDTFNGFGMHGTALRFHCEIPAMKANLS